MVSSDGVKITEHGSSLCVQGLRVFELHPSEVAALREHFAAEQKGDYHEGLEEGIKIGRAERVPEDVRELVEEVKRLVREGDRRLRFQLAAKGDQAWADQMLDAIQRLEAAYSRMGAVDDPR